MIIGFGHRSGVGKDTAAQLLKTHLRRNGETVEIRGFASELKAQAVQLFGWAGLKDEIFYNNNREKRNEVLPKLGKTPLELWIEFGEAMRKINPYTWVELVFANAAADHILIPDVRHKNEAEIIKHYGGMIIKIERDVPDLTIKNIDKILADYDEWDAVVKNDGTMRELNDKLLELI